MLRINLVHFQILYIFSMAHKMNCNVMNKTPHSAYLHSIRMFVRMNSLEILKNIDWPGIKSPGSCSAHYNVGND